ncbi:MAG: hypothetical protein AAFY88_06000 [Acidobacteriota bacterium]
MSKKNCARFIVVIASILMLAVAPMTFAADSDGSGAVTVESLLDGLVDVIGDLFGGDSADETDDTEDEDGGVPDLSGTINPVG